MSIEIICLEEHTTDGPIGKATQQAIMKQAPYIADVNTTYYDDSAQQPQDRPRFLRGDVRIQLAGEPVEARLSAMDAAAIDMQVLSFSNVTQAVAPEQSAALARAANDRLAEAVSKRPTRFRGFSTLPWQSPSAAVQEVERTVRDLGLRATMLIGRPDSDGFLDNPRYEPILAKLAELDVPLYIHPGVPLPAVQEPYYGGFSKEVTARLSLFGWGWHNEAGIHVLRLIFSGLLDRYPGLKIISGHWGEMVPFFLQRLDDMVPQGATELQRSISQTYRDQVWVTPSGMLNMPHFDFIRQTVGCDRVMFSVDYPYLTMTGARSWLEKLPISERERVAIANGNARALLKII